MIRTLKPFPGRWLAGLGLVLLSLNPAARAADDGVALHGFHDVSYVYDSTDDSTSFKLGPIDLYLAKQIDKKVNFVIEMAFEPNASGVSMDAERAFVQYTVDPWLKVAVGRFHTALGYWNDTYHHGTYLQTSVTRPVMERFEDQGGLLPTHTVGVELRGNGMVGSSNLGYIVNFGNGRGPSADPPTMVYSYNHTHSVSFVLYDELSNGLRFGPSFYTSKLPGGTTLADGTALGYTAPLGTETIYGAHLVYNSPLWEILTEYANIHHNYDDGNQNTVINALYAQAGIHVGLATPYVRYEINDTDHPDAYLRDSMAQGSRYFTAGTRYEVTSNSALKLEYIYTLRYSGDHSSSAILNWSYGW